MLPQKILLHNFEKLWIYHIVINLYLWYLCTDKRMMFLWCLYTILKWTLSTRKCARINPKLILSFILLFMLAKWKSTDSCFKTGTRLLEIPRKILFIFFFKPNFLLLFVQHIKGKNKVVMSRIFLSASKSINSFWKLLEVKLVNDSI